ncbi:alpha/beta hydrolase family protein [Chryseobacterium populi]|uniref:Prolyl oligopeptidase family protein n=1 Tax=Chryseobacterium populi TaxID=1144316 RepID=J2KMV0_9FLAO|nr:prolyl oligopeptidase family serine peptidase [Chryseobacterium populi]EJL74418.1 prolyl oligopeptidase family protein [Chryseobacterium populi]
MKRSVCIFILFFIGVLYPAQSKNDTLEIWMSKFYKLVNPVLSEDGKWAAVRKRYNANQDTLIVINTHKPNVPIATIAVNGESSFLKGEGILVFGGGTAELIGLKSGTRKHYDNARTAYPFSKKGQYGILRKDSVLSVYTMEGIRIHEIKGIQGLPVMDGNKSLYFCRKTGTQYEIINISGNETRHVGIIENKVKKIELSPSGKQLIITTSEKLTGSLQVMFMNTRTGKSVSFPNVSSGKDDYYKVTEIQEGKAYWVALYCPQNREEGLVDIWYGNDDNLGAKKTGTVKSRYWLWKPESEQVQELPNTRYPVIAPLNSERYFLAFHPTRGHNFLTYRPQFNETSIYDAEQQTYRPLGTLKGVFYGSPELICSMNSKMVLGSEDGKRWTLFGLESAKKSTIEKDGLRNPVFSDDNQSILFESEDGLWKYNIKNKVLTHTNVWRGKTVKIMNPKQYDLSPPYQFAVTSFERKKPILVEITDRSNNLTSYSIWRGDTVKEIVSPTRNRVRDIVFGDRLENFCTLEENYNLPPQLFLRDSKQDTQQLIYGADFVDQSANLLRQDIIHYTTADGLPLKGILYYPSSYSPNKKYPMVVYIYQIQSSKSNEYLTPGYNNSDGFDIRTLLEKGYFVLLPDTFIGSAGAGVSALDCVNKALDIVSKTRGIDMKKVGLIGHSFGGYEVNFIATQSDRFTTFISGSGHSDIVNSYFSYNYHFTGPHYWQYENGQYDMKVAFSENKDLYFRNNPIYNVERVNTPMLLWTGQKDENVPWNQTMTFFIGLKRNKKPVIALFYPNGGHAFHAGTAEKKDLYNKVFEWWDYYLKDRKNVSWINRKMEKGAR